MKKISLQFQSLLELVNFTIAVGVVNYEINRTAFQLTCDLAEKDIQRALTGFRGQVITIHEVSPSSFNPYSTS